MRKSLTIFMCSFVGLVSFAQQDAQFSMNMFNRLGVNPGYAGTTYSGYKSQGVCATLLYRNQWTGFSGGPKSILFSADYGTIFNGGVGLTVSQDKAGFEKTTMAKLAYSYHLHVGTSGVLGIGADVGMLQKGLNGDFRSPDGYSTGNPGPDNSIPYPGTSATTYDLGLGIYYTTKRLYVGISSLHLPEQTLKKTEGGTGGYSFDYTVARHYYIMAGYTFMGQSLDLTPSILTKSDATSTQLDVNLMAKWKKMLFFGVSYRLTDAAVAMVGLEWMNFKVGYAYDYTLSPLKNHSSGSHEIMLGFCHKFPKPDYKQSHVNVRFL